MAVGAPLVISSNAAPLKWRPFSSCFNLSPLQRYIILLHCPLPVCLHTIFLSGYVCACPHMSAWIHLIFPAHEHEHMQRGYSANTCMKTKDARNVMHCLFNHVLWADSVIMLSSARFNMPKLGRHSTPCSSLIIPHFNGRKREENAI